MPGAAPGKPLARQLSLRDGQRVWFDSMPEAIEEEIAEYALELTFVAQPEEGVDAAHVFVTAQEQLISLLDRLRPSLSPDGHIWVSWPSEDANTDTALGADAIRDAAEPHGLVVTRTLDVDEDWAGMKLVIRKELR